MSVYCRRDLLGLGVSVVLAGLSGCGKKPVTDPDLDDGGASGESIDPKLAQQDGTLEWAVSGNWRNAVDKSRDKYRHPIEMLKFFEVDAKSSVVDLWPGAGYMSEILAPFLAHGKGQYIPALFESGNAADTATLSLKEKYQQHFNSNKKLYGPPTYTEFGPGTGALIDAGTADCVLFLLVIQDMMGAGIAEKAFSDAFSALKPGGILGVEQHRADIGNVQDPGATSGYVQEPFVKQLAAEVGFAFVGASEMNANPKDDKDHPFGVWTLPPQRLTAPRGQPPNPDFDGTLYESIGESDRMTLKFRKPE